MTHRAASLEVLTRGMLLPAVLFATASCQTAHPVRPSDRPAAAAFVPARAGAIALVPAAGGGQELPPHWNFAFMDWSTGAPEPTISYGSGRLNFHLTGPGATQAPVKAHLDFQGAIPKGIYHLTGRLKVDGNNGRIQLRDHNGATLAQVRSGGSRVIAVQVVADGRSAPFDFRLTGDGAFWGTLSDLRLQPAQP